MAKFSSVSRPKTRSVLQLICQSPDKIRCRVEAATAGRVKLIWPAAAPEITQTVVLWTFWPMSGYLSSSLCFCLPSRAFFLSPLPAL